MTVTDGRNSRWMAGAQRASALLAVPAQNGAAKKAQCFLRFIRVHVSLAPKAYRTFRGYLGAFSLEGEPLWAAPAPRPSAGLDTGEPVRFAVAT
jgi:hypothetical protein